MSLNQLEHLGRLASAKESVRIAQLEIDEAIRMVVGGVPVSPGSLDLSGCVATALVSADQAVVDLEALGKSLK